MKNNYQINQSRTKQLRDAASVRFHVDNDDYFGTAATVLRLLQKYLDEAIKKTPLEERALIQKTFKNMQKDLMILQNNYQIKASQKKGNSKPKDELKSQ